MAGAIWCTNNGLITCALPLGGMVVRRSYAGLVYFFFLQAAMMFDPGRPRAGAWQGSGEQHHPDCPAGSRRRARRICRRVWARARRSQRWTCLATRSETVGRRRWARHWPRPAPSQTWISRPAGSRRRVRRIWRRACGKARSGARISRLRVFQAGVWHGGAGRGRGCDACGGRGGGGS